MSRLLSDSLGRGGGENPLLSIVVPVYNVEKYLRQCLNSLVRQTLKNIEIIVVNDCSPDNSEAIILEYMQRDPRIVYIRHEQNKCLGGARNTGIRAARGKYIAFVDSDDYVDAHLYESAVRAFEKHEVDLVVFACTSFHEEEKWTYITEGRGKIVAMDAQNYALDFSYVVAWDKVYRTADLREHDILFPEHIYFEDSPFWVDFCCAIQPRVLFLSRSGGTYHYRHHSQSITAKTSQNSFVMPRIFLMVYQSLKKHGWDHRLFSVYHIWVGGVTNVVYQGMDHDHRQLFAQQFALFTLALELSKEEYEMVPEWLLMKDLEDAETQMKLIDVYRHSNALASNHWYKFGQMSTRQRMSKVMARLRGKPRRTFAVKK